MQIGVDHGAFRDDLPTPDDEARFAGSPADDGQEIGWRHGDWTYQVQLGGDEIVATARSGAVVRRIRAASKPTG